MTRAPRPVTVLHTVRSLRVDGVVKVILRNLAHGDGTRFRHHVCAMLPRDAVHGELASRFRALGIEPVFAGFAGPASVPATISRLMRLIDELGIDVVHANRTLDLALAGTAAKLRGRGVVSTLHWLGHVDDHPEDAAGPWLARRAEMMSPVVLNRVLADRVIAVSDAVARSFARLPGFPSSRVEVVYPGVEMTRAPLDADARAALRVALDVGGGPLLLNVGRLEPVKGQRQLVPVMQRVLERVPDATLLIAGDGELRGALERDIDAAGLGRAIRLLGTRSDVDALLDISSALVLASESEAAPLPLLEAMRAGRAVVATDVGGVREIVRDGESGIVVPRGDANALADALCRLLQHPDTASRMGEAGRRIAAERFDVAVAMHRLEQIYARLAERRGRSDGSPRTAQTVSQ